MKCPHCSETHPDTFYFCTVTGADLAPWEALVNRTYVERYRLKRLLDTAGRGALFEAETLAGGNRVAIKIVHPSAARGSDAADRYIEQAALAGSLGHPHLPDGVEAGRDEGGAPYIVRRFVRGQSLASRMDRSGPLPIEEAVRAATNVLSALIATHARGLYHLAITPSRIFLSDVDAGTGGGALLMDYGSAVLTPSAEVAPYRAPEVKKDGEGGIPADMYAVAASLYEALTGKPPFSDGSGARPSARSLRPEVPEGVDRAVEKGLSQKPEDRFPDAESFFKALSSALPAPAKPADATAAKPAAATAKAPKKTMLGVAAPLKAADLEDETEAAGWSAEGAPSAAAPEKPRPEPTAAAPEKPRTEPTPVAAKPATTLPEPTLPEPKPAVAARVEAPKPVVVPETRQIAAEQVPKEPAPVQPAREEATRDSVPPFVSATPFYTRPAFLVTAGIAVLLAAALIVVVGGEEGQQPSIEGPSVRVVIRSGAPGAVLSVDGAEAESNPFESRFPQSDVAHKVKAVAPGFAPRELLVIFDRDREITLDLLPEEGVATAPTPPPLPDTAAAPESAAPETAAPETAAPETAAPAPETSAPASAVAGREEGPRTARPGRRRQTSQPSGGGGRTKQPSGGFVTENPFD